WLYLTALLLLVAAELTALLAKDHEPHKIVARKAELRAERAPELPDPDPPSPFPTPTPLPTPPPAPDPPTEPPHPEPARWTQRRPGLVGARSTASDAPPP